MALIQLIFQSTLLNEGEPSLAQIFHACRHNNKLNNISGLILCSGAHFFEMMEGERDVVENTYQRICADRRHRVTHAWGNSELIKREFPKWVSGYRRVKRGVAPSSKIHESYFFDDYDIYNLYEGSGLLRDKLQAFHFATVNDLFQSSPFSSHTVHYVQQPKAA